MDSRSQRGLALAKEKGTAIKPIAGTKWVVPSASGAGGYIVDVAAGTCTCPDWETLGAKNRTHRCKHVWATLYTRREIPLPDGSTAVFEEETRINYPRDWHATNVCRTLIPRLAPTLLTDLVDGLGLEPPAVGRRGRPAVPVRDVLLTAALRTFEEKTAGEAVVATENFCGLAKTTMTKVPSYNTLLRRFADPAYMPLLHRMVAGSALPLIPLESVWAVDGTGFGTSVYDCYHEDKHGPASRRREPTKRHRWVDATIVYGARTHVIPAVQVTERGCGECPLMPELLQRVVDNGGRVSDWLGDAAYLAWYNVEAVERVGGNAYFDWRKGVTGKTRPAIRRLYDRFRADQEEYWGHYHQRSHAESGNQMIKTRFGHYLRSRVPNAQYAESMLRAVCHNVACLVQAVQELNVQPKYWAPQPALATSSGEAN